MERVVKWTVAGPKEEEVVQVEVSQNGGNGGSCVVNVVKRRYGKETGAQRHYLFSLGEAGDEVAGSSKHRGVLLGRGIIDGVALVTGGDVREER